MPDDQATAAPSPDTTALTIDVPGAGTVSALLQGSAQAHTGLVLAHGAGAGMTHPFMTALATALAGRGVATLRYQFPFMEKGSKRPDGAALAQATVRAAVAQAQRCRPALPWFAGGKSFGGRMTSQAQAEQPLPGVHGLVFVGFPLHAAGKPGIARAAHLARITCPMLFLQGTRDALADLSLLTPVLAPLPQAQLVTFDDADHAFHVRARSGRTDAQVLDTLADTVASTLPRWAGAMLTSHARPTGPQS